MRRHHCIRRGLALGLMVMFAATLAGSAVADDVTGTAEVTGGSLTMSATDGPTFTAANGNGFTLNGTDQTKTDPFNIDVVDARGTGAGWNLQITSTTFSTGGATPKTLATNASQITAVSVTCDQGTCTGPSNSITYPLTVPAGSTPPTAVKFYNTAVDTGMGDFTVTPTWSLSVPANAYAGTYTSTVTITIASGP
uniref:WxL domain-containing protein n=1 Tax=Thermorudis peleae TaxID=1382356 RepID=A0A831TEY6_9BACT